jgi:hypothetical protein
MSSTSEEKNAVNIAEERVDMDNCISDSTTGIYKQCYKLD